MNKELPINKQNIFVKQQGPYECWYACYLMVLQYMRNVRLNYDAEKATVRNSETYKNYLAIDPDANPFRDGAGDDFLIGILNDQGYQFTRYTAENTPQMANRIEESFNKNKPVILGFNRGTEGGHFVFVYGISGDVSTGWQLTYLDPEVDINNCVKTVALSDPSIASILI
ncbi:MAG: C39 family peptidase [Roseburia sp.]|nr:C39 family peptidase [Roseburia sp.]MCM1278109.1 C39 family peptidase [Robinsoniella sp.]